MPAERPPERGRERSPSRDPWVAGPPPLVTPTPTQAAVKGRSSRIASTITFTAIGIAATIVVKLGKEALDQDTYAGYRSAFFASIVVVAAAVLIAVVVRRARLLTLSSAEAAATLHAETVERRRRTPRLAWSLVALGLVTVALFFLWRAAFDSTRPTLDLRVGQCFSVAGQESGLERVPVVDCTQAHELEVTAQLSYPAPPGVPYPGRPSLDGWAEPRCEDAFVRYTGMAYTREAGLWVTWYVPEAPYWDQGVRTVYCAVGDLEAKLLVGSVRARG